MSDEVREIRARNYALKRANGFRCAVEGCPADYGIVVVAYGDKLATACLATHAADADHVEPHQFPQSVEHEAALLKQPSPPKPSKSRRR